MKYDNVLDLIGNTPLVKLENYSGDKIIYAKLEKVNLAGSIKDRVAKVMIEKAIEDGLINNETTIIEPTSGNTGIGLALICSVKKMKCIIVMPASMSKERIQLMKAYGAQVVLSDAKLGMKGAVDEANRIHNDIKNSFIPSQFGNYNCVLAHYLTTGPEIYTDFKEIDCLIAGIGTGATISGVGKYLKEKNPNIHIVGVEPSSSPLLTKNKSGAHKIQGIGANFIPKNYLSEYVDEIIDITDEEAYEKAIVCAKNYGLFVGISSGAALAAINHLSNKYKNIVAILPDGGERYLSVWDLEK